MADSSAYGRPILQPAPCGTAAQPLLSYPDRANTQAGSPYQPPNQAPDRIAAQHVGHVSAAQHSHYGAIDTHGGFGVPYPNAAHGAPPYGGLDQNQQQQQQQQQGRIIRMVGDVPVQVTQQPPNRQEPPSTVPQDLPPPYQPAPHPLPTHMYMQAPNNQYMPVGLQPQPPNAQYVPVVHQVHPATQYVPVVHQPRPMTRPSDAEFTRYSFDGDFYRNQLFVSVLFLVCGVLCLNVIIIPCALYACVCAIKAADANKEDRRPDAQRFHQQAKYCNIAVLVFSVVGVVLLFFGGIAAVAAVSTSSTTE